MNRRDFLKVLRDASVAVPVAAIVGNLPAVENGAILPEITWEWVNASESNREWGHTMQVTQGTADIWTLATQVLYTP